MYFISFPVLIRKEATKRFVRPGGIWTTYGWSVPDFLVGQRWNGEGKTKLIMYVIENRQAFPRWSRFGSFDKFKPNV